MGKRGRPPHPDILTPREWEVLGLLREGLTNEQIAECLGITPDGAEYHVSQILSKLGVESREEAARWAAMAVAGRRWRFLGPIPLAAKVAGIAIVIAVGVAMLAWVALSTNETDDEVASIPPAIAPTATTPRGDCPPGGQCPATPVWERTGDYQASNQDITLTVLYFKITAGGSGVAYALTHENPDYIVEPGEFRLRDDQGRSYQLMGQGDHGSTLGVLAGSASFERPPDDGATLTLVLHDATVTGPDGKTSADLTFEIAFVRNVDTNHGPGYTEGMRIAPENAASNGATLLYGNQNLSIRRNGQETLLSWREKP